VPKPYKVVRLADAVSNIMASGRDALDELADVGFSKPRRCN